MTECQRPSSWFACFVAHRNCSVSNEVSSVTRSCDKNGIGTVHRILTPKLDVLLTHGLGTSIQSDVRSGVTLLLHGEVFADDSAHTGVDHLLKQYTQREDGFPRDINGSFSLLIIDKHRDAVKVVTDRLNARKVFLYRRTSGCWLSSELDKLPIADLELDLCGVAHFLANGVPFNQHTLFEGVTVLERASIHTLDARFHTIEPYWTYDFDRSRSQCKETDLQDELATLVLDGVRRRLPQSERAFVALSGGYDSAVILGSVRRLGFTNGESFSYSLPNPLPEADAAVAKQMAAVSGLPHRMVLSYHGNVVRTITENARHSRGMCVFCDEMDAWLELADHFKPHGMAALFFGDGAFDTVISPNSKPTSFDILNANHVRNFSGLQWLRTYLGSSTYRRLRDALGDDLKQILRRAPPTMNGHEREAFFYLDQRVSNYLLGCRERIMGCYVTIRCPFLDNAILDFVKSISVRLRHQKRLFIDTARRMFPELLSTPRAKQRGYRPDWRNELLQASERATSELLEGETRLDEIVPAKCLSRVLQDRLELANSQLESRSLCTRAMRAVGILPKQLAPPVSPTDFVLRSLQIRSMLKRISRHADTSVAFPSGLPCLNSQLNAE